MRSALAALLLVSCSSEQPAASANTLRFETLEYTLDPGQEKFFCYTMSLPADRETAITAFAPIYGKLVHHLVFSYTKVPEPEGFSECPVRFKDSWVPLFEGGRESGSLALPAGSAVRFRGQQLLIQLHLLNATRERVTEKSGIELTTADPSTVKTSAGIFGLDNRVFEIPPKSTGSSAEMTCAIDHDMDVFAVLGHMHERGESIELRRGAEILFRTQWVFERQPTTPVQFNLKKGDTLNLRCTWTNESDKTINYGDSAADEMCSLIWYFTPYVSPGGCAKL